MEGKWLLLLGAQSHFSTKDQLLSAGWVSTQKQGSSRLELPGSMFAGCLQQCSPLQSELGESPQTPSSRGAEGRGSFPAVPRFPRLEAAAKSKSISSLHWMGNVVFVAGMCPMSPGGGRTACPGISSCSPGVLSPSPASLQRCSCRAPHEEAAYERPRGSRGLCPCHRHLRAPQSQQPHG